MRIKYIISIITLFALYLLLPQTLSSEECTPILEGRTITFASDRDGDMEIYTMYGNECNLIQLTNNTFPDYDPAISPDGTKIAFTSVRDDGNTEIFLMDIDGSNQIQLTHTQDPGSPTHPFHYGPAWSPDGAKIAYVQGPRAANQEIWVMDANGNNQHMVENGPSDVADPNWFPNGTQMAFTSRACAACRYDWEIGVINADGTGRFNLISTPTREQGPKFSPDGSKLLFASNRDNRDSWEVYIANADGSNQTRLTYSDGLSTMYPDSDWSADGDKIVFASNKSGTAQLYVMDPDGNNLIRLTNNGYNDTNAVWGGLQPHSSDVGDITAPLDPVKVNIEITASALFTDQDAVDTHTAEWYWGDGTTSIGTVDETNGSGSATGKHTYLNPGVYIINLTVTDRYGLKGMAPPFRYLVVYDPDGGFVTGGGWIDSPAGAYLSEPALTGRANFGFVSKYKKGAIVPTGQTEFQFQVAKLNFYSDSYDWLVVAGPKAMYKGTGTINGYGNYGFILSIIDEKLTPSTDVDLFRIKIWDKDSGDAVVYDNQVACTGGEDDADPCTAIGGGSIVIHKAN